MNHHWLSQFYLNGFIDRKYGRLTVFDKISQRISYKAVDNLCSEKDFFALDGIEKSLLYDEMPVDEYILEREISKLEHDVALILKSIREMSSFKDLTKSDIDVLLAWTTWMLIANPDTRKIPIKHNSLGTKTQHMGAFIDWYARLKPVVVAKTWILHVSEDPILITSDRPISLNRSLANPKDVIALSKSMIVFPLSPKLLLIGIPNDKRGFFVMKEPSKIGSQDIDFFNQITFDNARQLVLATDKAIIGPILNQRIRRNLIRKILIVINRYRSAIRKR